MRNRAGYVPGRSDSAETLWSCRPTESLKQFGRKTHGLWSGGRIKRCCGREKFEPVTLSGKPTEMAVRSPNNEAVCPHKTASASEALAMAQTQSPLQSCRCLCHAPRAAGDQFRSLRFSHPMASVSFSLYEEANDPQSLVRDGDLVLRWPDQ